MNDWKNWPHYDQDEIDAVQRVLASARVNYWNGDEGRRFETEFARYHGVPYAVAVANGSVALDLALHALAIGSGDDVVVTPRSFVASVSTVVLAGARPVFADVDRDSQNITPDSVRAVMTPNTRAILAVHLAGWPCDLAGLRDLADDRGLQLIEDCAQAHGSSWCGQPVGSFGDAAAFSFCTDKIMTTGGEGGMLLLREDGAWRRARSFKDHGKNWDAVCDGNNTSGFSWLHESFGTNWRLTEMQSAIGRVQLRKLNDWVERRRANARILIERMGGLPGLRIPVPPDTVGHAYYKFYAFVRQESLAPGWDRDAVIQALEAEGVPCMQGSCPEIYREKAFTDAGLSVDQRLPVARELGETSLMFPVHPTLDANDMNRMADAVEAVMARATS